jgi:hypothetical protein
LFVPFDVTAFDASPVLHKLLVAEVVIVLEKVKRQWSLGRQAKVIFNWRFKKVPKTAHAMGHDISGFTPIFVRENIKPEGSSSDELAFYVLPCEEWPDGATVLHISGNTINIDDDSPPFRFFKPKPP